MTRENVVSSIVQSCSRTGGYCTIRFKDGAMCQYRYHPSNDKIMESCNDGRGNSTDMAFSRVEIADRLRVLLKDPLLEYVEWMNHSILQCYNRLYKHQIQ